MSHLLHYIKNRRAMSPYAWWACVHSLGQATLIFIYILAECLECYIGKI